MNLAPLIAAPATSISDVIATMQAIDQSLPDADGLKWFNFLYLSVTQEVQNRVAAGGVFSDPAWIAHLDVVFANLYFRAVSASAAEIGAVSRAWRPLFESRFNGHIARIQFALAGMNAHINRDLVVALIQTHQDLGTIPAANDSHHADYTIVNGLLANVEALVKPILLTGVVRDIDGTLGPLDDVIAMWSVQHAREAAWTNSEALWVIRDVPFLADRFVDALDQTTGFAGRGLLIPTQP